MKHSVGNSNYAISGDYEFDEKNQEEQQLKSQRLNNFLNRASSVLIFLNILLYPFLFGGVHERSYLSFKIGTFTLLAFAVISQGQKFSEIFSLSRAPGKALASLILLQFGLIAHLSYFYLDTVFHPILGKISRLFDPQSALNFILEFSSFIALFVMTLFWINYSGAVAAEKRSRTLSNLIIFAGFIVSLTALAHWFYDNGKLFWIFTPNTESVSSRARWPFVNSNHLGIYLILPLFTAIGKSESLFLELKLASSKLSHRGKLILSDFFSDIETQKLSRNFILTVICLLTFTLGIIASLSRNALASSFVGLILFFFLSSRKKSNFSPLNNKRVRFTSSSSVPHSSQSSSEGRRKSRRRSSHNSNERLNSINITKLIPSLKNIWRLTLFCLALTVLWFLLGEKGGELFRSRLEYALIYTQDDMRWQLYKDSFPMLLSAPVLGIGISNWAMLYPRFMAEGLSGMDPVFLHSDLFQILIETGLIGGLAFLTCFVFITLLVFKGGGRAGKKGPSDNSRALLIGIFSLLLSAGFDFPLRIPAIVAALAICIALELHNSSNQET